jgi:Uma2 family endonuclease
MKPIQTVSHPSRIYLPEDEIRSEDGLAVSEEEYWEKYYDYCGDSDFRYEWNNGYLEEKPVSDYANDLVSQWFIGILRSFLHVHPIGKLVTVEMGFRLALPRETTIRLPDFAVVLNTNPVPLNLKDCSYSGIFDLISDLTLKGIRRDTVQKKREYGAIGVKEYFILDAKGEHTAFYRRNDALGSYENIIPTPDAVIQSGVLPGFQFRISDLYRQPSYEDMAEDPVYREHIYVVYQTEKHRADQAEKQLIEERQRAEQERQRADRLAEKLRSLGISPE